MLMLDTLDRIDAQNQQIERDPTLTLLKTAGALRTGHFALDSGLHTAWYLDMHVAASSARAMTQLTASIGECFSAPVDVVVGCGRAGSIIAYATASYFDWCNRHDTTKKMRERQVYCTTAEKQTNEVWLCYTIDPQHVRFVQNKNVLVSTAAIETGDTARAAIKCVEAHHGLVVGLATLWNRGYQTAQTLGVEDDQFHALVQRPMPGWDEVSCPYCRVGTILDEI